MSEDEYTGGCMCGALRYRATGAPLRVGLCHCEPCRRNTGAPFMAFAVFSPDRVTILSGETKFFQSSPRGKRHFCRDCGAPVFSEWSDTNSIDINLGSLDQPERLSPSYELWAIRRSPWLPEMPGLARYERDPPG